MPSYLAAARSSLRARAASSSARWRVGQERRHRKRPAVGPVGRRLEARHDAGLEGGAAHQAAVFGMDGEDGRAAGAWSSCQLMPPPSRLGFDRRRRRRPARLGRRRASARRTRKDEAILVGVDLVTPYLLVDTCLMSAARPPQEGRMTRSSEELGKTPIDTWNDARDTMRHRFR